MAGFLDRLGDRALGPWTKRGWRLCGWLLVAFLLVDVALGWYWSREPRAPLLPLAASAPPSQKEAMPQALVAAVGMLLEKPGGYLSNDLMPHRLWLDNMPSWEYGALEQVRLLTAMLRHELGRPAGAEEDADLAIAYSQLHFDHRSWAMPSTESEYRRGIKALKRYVQRLGADGEKSAVFNATAANFDHWLASVQQHLQSLSVRLRQSLEHPQGKSAGDDPAQDSAVMTPQVTPRLQVDNVFYEARGAVWAMGHFLHASRVGFAPLLDNEEAASRMAQLLLELESAQASMGSPVMLNGSGFGVLANHSLILAGYLTRADIAIRDLRAWLGR